VFSTGVVVVVLKSCVVVIVVVFVTASDVGTGVDGA
jgi:hypothetical protein